MCVPSKWFTTATHKINVSRTFNIEKSYDKNKKLYIVVNLANKKTKKQK